MENRLPILPKQSKQKITCIVEKKGKRVKTIAQIETDSLTDSTKIEIGNTSIKFKTKDLEKII